ncbi:MAG: glycosyltransferase [Rhizomicrobium sp.]
MTVAIPCYNAEKWIARAIDSVLDQNYPDLRVIVIDDGSTDGSLAILDHYGSRITWEQQPHKGAAAARNTALALSTTEWILFLDADDYIEHGSLDAWVAAGAKADVVFGPFQYEWGGRRWNRKAHSKPVTSQSILSDWLSGCFTPPCAILWRRSFLSSTGGWQAISIRADDGNLVMRSMLMGARPAISDRGCGVYVQHDSPHRLSKRSGPEILTRDIEMFRSLWAVAEKQYESILRLEFAGAFYGLAYEAYAGYWDEIGDIALAEARRLGLHGHVGSGTHRLLAGALGLRNKLRLTGLIKRRNRVGETG